MFSRKIVKEVLKRTSDLEYTNGISRMNTAKDEDFVISMLIHDIFGGEILKTHFHEGWHFYNRINGERLDFSESDTEMSNDEKRFEDIPSTPDETSGYIDKTDYSTFFMRFVKTFEEKVGLGRQKYGLSA
jgi:hypothetical protein